MFHNKINSELKTYLPYPCVIKSANCLDAITKKEQICEAKQLILTIEEITLRSNIYVKSIAHHNDFYTRFWYNFLDLLKVYYHTLNPSDSTIIISHHMILSISSSRKPSHFGNALFHQRHQQELLNINPDHYAIFKF